MLGRLRRKFRVSIHVTLVSIFVMATGLTAALAIGLHYYFSTHAVTEAAWQRFQITAQYTADVLARLDDNASKSLQMLASNPSFIDFQVPRQSDYQLFARYMENNPVFYALHLSKPTGDFYQLINLNAAPLLRKHYQVGPQERWLMIESNRQTQQRTLRFLDKNFQTTQQQLTSSDFDPRQRNWYSDAKAQVTRSTPYQFASLQAPGITYSQRLSDGETVLALDIALASVSAHIHQLSLPDGAEVYLYRQNGELMASNQGQVATIAVPEAKPLSLTAEQQAVLSATPVLTLSNSKDWVPIDFSVAGKPSGYVVDLLQLVSQMTGLQIRYNNGVSWAELVAQFQQGQLDGLQADYATPANLQLGLLSEPLLTLPYALVMPPQTKPVTSLLQLSGRRLAIAEGWNISELIAQHYPQVQLLTFPTPLAAITAVKVGLADAAIDSEVVLAHFLSTYFISELQLQPPLKFDQQQLPEQIHLLLRKELAPVLALINTALANVTPAQQAALARKWLRQDAANNAAKSVSVPHPELQSVVLDASNYRQLLRSELSVQPSFYYVARMGGSDDPWFFAIWLPEQVILAPVLNKVKWAIILTSAGMLLLLPLSYYFASPIEQPIRRLVEQNLLIQQRRFNDINTPHSHIREIDELANSLTAMAGSIAKHEQAQRELIESFIKLIAQAIDDKSPYTGGHCERVPELGMMLAQAAHQQRQGHFAEFTFANEEQWREFRIAAWLHDCGKITTPEHIVDKGSKLEAIYNRIHEVRMRFEVLWRDAEIDYYRQVALTPESALFHRQELKRKQQQLQDDFGFVASVNVGSEQLSDEAIARLQGIGQQRWRRHFDDRLGLSPAEQRFMADFASEPAPAWERLLQDQPYHQVPRREAPQFAEHWQIDVAVPELQANLGELYNLSVRRGTLTAEDRYRINEHIISTIKMLDSLPFPEELANVPRYASTHHETLDGRGYPRKLHGDQLSVPERILVLADVFEALTAADRPYKTAKTLSQALHIMQQMVGQQHIDADVFRLFIDSGVCLAYAERYLTAEQIDVTDFSEYRTVMASAS